MQTTPNENSQQSGGKNKNKNKKKPNPPKQDTQQTQDTPVGENKGKRKIRLPYMVCCELDHFTKDCPQLKEVQQYVNDCPNQAVVLTNPFPPQQKQAIAKNPAPPPGGNVGHQPQGAG